MTFLKGGALWYWCVENSKVRRFGYDFPKPNTTKNNVPKPVRYHRVALEISPNERLSSAKDDGDG